MGVSAGVGVEVASLALAAYGTYQASQAGKNVPKLPQTPVPKLPDTGSLANANAQADIQAKTAGGTILSDQKRNIGDGNAGVRKTLLGS